MIFEIFFLIRFALSNNYCVGISEESCKNKCKAFSSSFDEFFTHIPTDNEISASGNAPHYIFIAENVSYYHSEHNFIFCDPSIRLIYKVANQSIKIKNDSYFASNKTIKNVPLLFQFDEDLDIDVEADKNSKINPIVLESTEYGSYIRPKFLTDDFPENLISFSSNSRKTYINGITSNVKKLFTNTENIYENSITYYCLSDKENKCEKYNSTYNLKYITSTSQMGISNNYLIVETTKPVILAISCSSRYDYTHVIAMPGSDITYYPNYQPKNGEFYVIMHPDHIEMSNLYFEGEGNFTFSPLFNFSIHSTTKTNNFKFSIKNRELFKMNNSYIYPLKDDFNIELDKKINVPELSMFHGPKCLSGLFESDKFIPNDVFYNVTVDDLVEYDLENITYYFKKGDHEIPVEWKRPCRFQGIYPNETNFIFSDVYSYDGKTIDNFIDVNEFPSQSHNMITIRPASYFYLNSFKYKKYKEYVEKYTIVVDNNFVMDGVPHNNVFDIDEISHDQCKITGSGTISFYNRDFMNDVREFCTIDSSIELKLIENNPKDIYACVGQQDPRSCKLEIRNLESGPNIEWIWLRNLRTREHFNIKKTYITDKYLFIEDRVNCNLILTAKASLTLLYSNYSDITLYKNNVSLSYNRIIAQSKSAKLRIVFHYDHYYYSYYTRVDYEKEPFNIMFREEPTDIDLQFFMNFENVKLCMKYINIYIPETIKLRGKCQIYVREVYQSRINIFDVPETIIFSVNPDFTYRQILYSDSPIESDNLNDFVFCSTLEEYKKYESKSSYSVYIYKNISLSFDESFSCPGNSYYFQKNVTANIDLPKNVSLNFYNGIIMIVYNGAERHYFHIDSTNSLIFNVKDMIMIDCSSFYYYPLINFTSSKESVEIFPGPFIHELSNSNFVINVPENFLIYSPVPQYIKGLFSPCQISYSNEWSYYYLSEEAKLLYDTHPAKLFDNFENDDDLPERFVLAISENDVLTVPSSWINLHKVYIYQNQNRLIIDKPSHLSFIKDGCIVNEKFKIVMGKVTFKVPENMTMDAVLYYRPYLLNLLYNTIIDFSENLHTDLYGGSSSYDLANHFYVSNLITNNLSNTLTVHSENENRDSYWRSLLKRSNNDKNVNFRIDYDYICYYPPSDHYNKCSGKYYRITDVNTLFFAVSGYPDLIISVAYDIDIPQTTGDYYKLDPINENIVIKVPDSPELMTITENKTVQFNYTDSTLFDILNKSIINVELEEPIKLLINSDTDSQITFSLKSDVFVTSDSFYNPNFQISVEKNSHHLYSEEADKFGNLFGNSLEPYIRICVYDSKAISFCTFPKNVTIKDAFSEHFDYNEIEIALSSTPQEIRLPSINYPINANILDTETTSSLTIKGVSDLLMTSSSIVLNEFWNFIGNLKALSLVKTEKSFTLSITDQISSPLTLQLSNNQTSIDLKNCVKQENPQIKIQKYGNENNEIIVFGTDEAYQNFIESLINYDNISIIHDGTQKYLCLCKDENSCEKCKEGIDGIIDTGDSIRSDPGEDVQIRVFSNIEMSSTLFTNYHDVFIDPDCIFNLTDTNTVNQNIETGLNVDMLHFSNVTNLFLKPTDIALNIEMKKIEMGPYFNVEVDTFLRLNVTNTHEEKLNSSRLEVYGHGELNCYNYPFYRIRAEPTVRVIKGIYLVCNSGYGNNYCTYESIEAYRQLDNCNYFKPEFDANTKILVFMESFASDLTVDLGYLKRQPIQFVRKPFGAKRSIKSQSKLRVISYNNTQLTSCSNSTMTLESSSGGALFNNSDSDQFVVGFVENLTVKQEGNISSNLNGITVLPLSDNVNIFIDDSVDVEKQKLKIESDSNKTVSVNVISSKNNANEDVLKKFIDTDESKVSVSFGEQKEKPDVVDPVTKSPKKGFPTGAIIGIVISAVVVIAVVIVVIVFVAKRNKGYNDSIGQNQNEFSDSSF